MSLMPSKRTAKVVQTLYGSAIKVPTIQAIVYHASFARIMSSQVDFDEGPLRDPDERRVVFAALDSFRQYRRNAHQSITHRRRQNFYALPKRQWQVLAAAPFDLLNTLSAVDDAVDFNADLAEAILDLGLHVFGLPPEPAKDSSFDWHNTAKSEDLAKAHSTVRQFFRDWSSEGFVAEVKPLLDYIINDLKTQCIVPSEGSEPPSLLFPGAGLGRILFSMSLEGYNVEGNEISYHQLLASNFVLNATQRANQYELYPFASTFTNHKTRANQLRRVHVPDIHPATVVLASKSTRGKGQAPVGKMNMTAGDFLTSYGDSASQGTFDAVISVYFIDTAPNLIRYIETVRNCLKADGIWINLGPLLWHHDDRHLGTKIRDGDDAASHKRGHIGDQQIAVDTGIAEPGSFELTDEEVILLLQKMGFAILKHDYVPPTFGGYIQDERSMIQNRYECSHWVARKNS